jgi:hypothetical protein
VSALDDLFPVSQPLQCYFLLPPSISCTAAAVATASSLLLGFLGFLLFLLGEVGDRAGAVLGCVVLDYCPESWRIGRSWATARHGSGGMSRDDLGISKQP